MDRDEVEAGVGYLIEAGAWDDVLRAAATHGREVLGRGRGLAIARWMEAVPVAIRRRDTAVMLLESAGLVASGDAAGAREVLDLVDADPSAPAAHRAVASLQRAYAALDHGAPAEAVAAADAALRHLEDARDADLPDLLGLTGNRADVALAAQVVKASGLVYLCRFEEARAVFDVIPDVGDVLVQLAAYGSRALLEAWAGRLSFAERLGNRAVAIARQFGVEEHPVASDAILALVIVARERDELAAARELLELLHPSRFHRRRLLPVLVATEQARLALAEGHPAAGLTILAASRRLGAYGTVPAPIVAARQAVEAELLLQSGDLAGASRALDRAPVDTTEVSGAQVRLAIDRGDVDAARPFLARWPAEPDPRAQLERRVWAAVIDDLSGDAASARRRMAAAVDAAEPERHVHPFLNPHAVSLIRSLYRESPTPFLRTIADRAPAPAHVKRVKELVEQLTEREYMVLPLLSTRMSNVEIAEALGVSLNTVKTHLKHIYRKLGVVDRGEAVVEAERLHLI